MVVRPRDGYLEDGQEEIRSKRNEGQLVVSKQGEEQVGEGA